MNSSLFSFIKESPSPYHAVAQSARLLDAAGFLRLEESHPWDIIPGSPYYVTRNGSSLIAFRVPKDEPECVMLAAAHADSPTFRIKDNAELADKTYVRLATEKYGGMIYSTWMDRPLSVAGRVTVRTPGGVENRLVDLDGVAAVIPNVAIHMNPGINDGMKYNPAVDMIPLFGAGSSLGSFREHVAEACRVRESDILRTDLSLYVPEEGIEWGDFISAPRLDDLQCAFAALRGFISAGEGRALSVYCLFDNEEVGSQTKQGAASTFLHDVIARVCEALGMSASDRRRMLASGMMLSCDNAHAIHPNHPELCDPGHAARMNAGVVIKHNAAQKYTTDAVSASLFSLICEDAGVLVQDYANRADIPGGSTLGSISDTRVSLNSVDIGLAQLAMHSAFETAGADDTGYMVSACRAFFQRAVICDSDGIYRLL